MAERTLEQFFLVQIRKAMSHLYYCDYQYYYFISYYYYLLTLLLLLDYSIIIIIEFVFLVMIIIKRISCKDIISC